MSKHVALLQRGAREAGYYSGPLDGQWNADLSSALARVMIARGEPPAPHKPCNGLETQPENSGA
jgi:hypothetical protein